MPLRPWHLNVTRVGPGYNSEYWQQGMTDTLSMGAKVTLAGTAAAFLGALAMARGGSRRRAQG